MPEPVTMLGVATTTEELERAPSPSDLDGVDREVRVPWSVRGLSAGVGVLIGLVIGAVLLTFGLIGGGERWPLVAAVVLGALLSLALKKSSGLDARWSVGTAAVVLAGLAVAPLPGQIFGSSLILGIGSLVMVVVLVKVVRAVTALRADVVSWNDAYARLAADPRRAEVVDLEVEIEQHGGQKRFVGRARYVAEDGLERAVPLVSAEHLQMHFPAGVVISASSAATVWHTPDHAVVHTMVLCDPV